jgi:hypothetical protein
VGAASEPSINIDDPICDEFFFLGWNAAAKLNATIYEKVLERLLHVHIERLTLWHFSVHLNNGQYSV